MKKLPKMVIGMHDKHRTIEEPCNGKLLRTVLKTNGIGDNLVEFNVTQPWLVMVNGKEEFRANTWAKCYRFIQWHHKDGTLNNSQLPSRNSQLNSITKSQEFGSLMHQSPHDINNCELRTANCELPQAEAPTILEISFYDQEAFVGDYLVASISYDHGNYQNLYWRVLVNNVEIFRDLSAARCHSYIKQQYQQGTLPIQEQLPEEVCTTGNEIMAQIFNECEKFGFEILDDGIYNNDVKLGEVGHTVVHTRRRRNPTAHIL
ncbi:hypothetical protein LC653_39505 [Nostoc sp. CHAB 5784]|uniref:hypothetical protein n=1 Tax=Nostoc mirabile TaxID=2907820 RepID=UPI001E495D3C|nr:hypothetical protein [Nostoc mirabile]MCC5669736.1 hypothetical protein [Nostoc mirabile CHAB5784]